MRSTERATVPGSLISRRTLHTCCPLGEACFERLF